MAHADCRMYEAKYPEVDDVVMVQVKSIAEMGAYVALLEYNGIEGMILLSELSRRRIRSITKLIKVRRSFRVLGGVQQPDWTLIKSTSWSYIPSFHFIWPHTSTELFPQTAILSVSSQSAGWTTGARHGAAC